MSVGKNRRRCPSDKRLPAVVIGRNRGKEITKDERRRLRGLIGTINKSSKTSATNRNSSRK